MTYTRHYHTNYTHSYLHNYTSYLTTAHSSPKSTITCRIIFVVSSKSVLKLETSIENYLLLSTVLNKYNKAFFFQRVGKMDILKTRAGTIRRLSPTIVAYDCRFNQSIPDLEKSILVTAVNLGKMPCCCRVQHCN